MKLTDHELRMQFAYAKWQRCHVLYLDMECRKALGAAAPSRAAETIRADVERAMAHLVSVSPQRRVQGEVGTDLPPLAGFELAGYRAMPWHGRWMDNPKVSLANKPAD